MQAGYVKGWANCLTGCSLPELIEQGATSRVSDRLKDIGIGGRSAHQESI